jgi:transposase
MAKRGTRKRGSYPLEFRHEMVELVKAGRSPEELGKEFDVAPQTIRNWLRDANVEVGRASSSLTTAEREELKRLRRENKQLQLEREILSKAAAWFARETDVVPPKSSDS